MRLLVSAANVADARAALEGGADIIDAKDPGRGALGPVAPSMLRAMREVIPRDVPFSAALGDAATEHDVERSALAAAAVGLSYIKIGLLGVTSERRALGLIAAAVRGVNACLEDRVSPPSSPLPPPCSVIVVAYADVKGNRGIRSETIPVIAVRAGATGVLLDTADKRRGGLLAHMSSRRVGAWIAEARGMSLLTALAGRLTTADVPVIRPLKPDVIGVRGAACDGDRTGLISVERVRELGSLITELAFR